MTPEERENHTYLGDGVYLEKTPYEFILRTGSHKDSECVNKIYLDQSAINNFMDFIDNFKAMESTK